MTTKTAAQTGSGSTGTGYQHLLSAILGDRERFFTEVVQEKHLSRKLRSSIATVLALTAFYGLVTGSYSSGPQAVSAAIKLPLLFLATFLICFPAFFVVQILVGSRLRLLQVIVLVMGALALTAVLLAAFVPIVAFFLITGSNYYFLQLLHIVIVLLAGMFGMYALHDGLALVCEQHSVYPRKAVTIMRVWAIIFAFVGIQMAWNLRPFLGDRDRPFQVFRQYEGNFYAAVLYSVSKLIENKETDEPSKEHSVEIRQPTLKDLFQDDRDSAATSRRNR